MLKLWKNHQMFFAQHYHRRSNVESTFGMLNCKWGSYCHSKLPASQENEILAKIVCHNTAVLSESLLQYHLRKGFIANPMKKPLTELPGNFPGCGNIPIAED